MRIKMLSRVHTIAIVAVTMLMVGNSVGQEHKIIQKKSDSDSPNIVVWQSDDGEKIELDVEALKSDGGVFVFEKKDDKKAPKKKPQAFKWNFKSADSKDKKNNEMRFHSVDSKEGNVIVVVNEDGKKITKKFQVHGADGKENVWIEKDDDGKSGPHVIVLGDDQGKSGNKKIQIIGKDGAKGHWSEKGPAGKHVIILGDDHGEKKIRQV